MKMKEECYENYPLRIILISNMLSVSIFIMGTLVLYNLGSIPVLIYFLLYLVLEIRLFKKSCTNCYYFAKICAFGKGRVASYLFKKGNPKNFSEKKVTWYSMIPDFLIPIIPLVSGIIILIYRFDIVILFLLIAILILFLGGNPIIRSLTCKNCKQREHGCPAAELFTNK